jgi:hypothetical protein
LVSGFGKLLNFTTLLLKTLAQIFFSHLSVNHYGTLFSLALFKLEEVVTVVFGRSLRSDTCPRSFVIYTQEEWLSIIF